MLVGRNHAASCTDGTRFYVFGGRSGQNMVGPGFGGTQVISHATLIYPVPCPFRFAHSCHPHTEWLDSLCTYIDAVLYAIHDCASGISPVAFLSGVKRH